MQTDTSSAKSIFTYGAILLALMAAGLWFITRFAASEAEQDLQNWQSRINLIADSRAAEVSTWLNRHLKAVEELAADASVQLYAAQVSSPDDQDAVEAQRGYIFSLISAEAERHGFHENRAIDAVAANVNRPRRAGIAVVSNVGQAFVMTTGMPLLRPEEIPLSQAQSFIALGPQLGDKTPLVIFGAKAISGAGAVWVIGARPLDGDFLQTLIQPGDDTQTSESYLVKPEDGGLVRVITPLAEGGRLGATTTDEAASFAVKQPGGFSTQLNYANTEVLVMGKELSAPVPWVLVRTIKTSEAVAAIKERRNSLILTLSLAGLFVLAALVLVWRHGISRKLENSYREQALLSEKNESLSEFLQSVTDCQPAAVAAVDNDMTVHFSNTQMSDITEIKKDDLIGRRLDTAFRSSLSEKMRSRIAAATGGHSDSLNVTHSDRTFRMDTIPLKAGGDYPATALMVMRDISDLVEAQAQSEELFKKLVSTLTQIIDARDPWSKHHSERVADVSVTIAQELDWATEDTECVNIAAQLVNVGKIFVPIEILTKQTPLTDEELTLVRESMQQSASLVAGLDFKGPVAAILDQIRENWDGSGELGKAGKEIEAGARVLAVANAFVGMVSARAHRGGLSFDKAADILHQESGSKFERRIVAALQNILENKGGRDRWSHYMEKPEEA